MCSNLYPRKGFGIGYIYVISQIYVIYVISQMGFAIGLWVSARDLRSCKLMLTSCFAGRPVKIYDPCKSGTRRFLHHGPWGSDFCLSSMNAERVSIVSSPFSQSRGLSKSQRLASLGCTHPDQQGQRVGMKAEVVKMAD